MKIAIFERDGRGVRLTAAGRRLCDEAEVLVAQRDRILEELTQNVMAGVVRLGVAETMTHTVLPRMLTDLRARHPLLRFEISVDTSDQMGTLLAQDGLDVVIMLRDQAPRGIILTALPPVTLGWFGSPAHFTLPNPPASTTCPACPSCPFRNRACPIGRSSSCCRRGADRWRPSTVRHPLRPRCIWWGKVSASAPYPMTSSGPGLMRGWRRSASGPRRACRIWISPSATLRNAMRRSVGK